MKAQEMKGSGDDSRRIARLLLCPADALRNANLALQISLEHTR